MSNHLSNSCYPRTTLFHSLVRTKSSLKIIVSAFFVVIVTICKNNVFVTRGMVSINDPKIVLDSKQTRRLSVNPTYLRRSLQLDPRTIEFKQPEISAQQQVTDLDLVSKQPVEFLAFGTSNTWGQGLSDHSTQSYPYLLSPDANNLGIRASDARYPALCLQSMIEGYSNKTEIQDDIIYDVIMIEYDVTDLDLLLQRVRIRYPDAIIISVFLWVPLWIYVNDLNGERLHLKDWVVKHNLFGAPFDSILAELKKLPEENILYPNPQLYQTRQSLIDAVGGHIMHLPFTTDSFSMLELVGKWFGPDMLHLSEEGHREVARRIEELVDSELKSRPPLHEKRLGTFGDGDDCNNWFLDGDCRIQYNASTGNLLPLDDTRQKFSVEFEQDGSLFIENKFNTTMILFLGHLAMGPSSTEYPLAMAHIVSKTISESKVILDQQVSHPYPVHISKNTKIGLIEPGITEVRFYVIEKSKRLPLRIVSTSIVSKDFDSDTDIKMGMLDHVER